ncbi:MAG: hypothetical protein ABL883_05715 [Terricaulis sp.]
MARRKTTRLREARDPAPPAGAVIDVPFKVVRKSAFWTRMRRRFYAVLIAAAIGLSLPPLWLLLQRLNEMAGR